MTSLAWGSSEDEVTSPGWVDSRTDKFSLDFHKIKGTQRKAKKADDKKAHNKKHTKKRHTKKRHT